MAQTAETQCIKLNEDVKSIASDKKFASLIESIFSKEIKSTVSDSQNGSDKNAVNQVALDENLSSLIESTFSVDVKTFCNTAKMGVSITW